MQYKFEGDIDFYKALENFEVDDCEEKCNITGQPLVQYNITLQCGHAFNYEPLYNEIKMQKSVKTARFKRSKLALGQMKCPLCRNVQPKILPWIPTITSCPKIIGVNTPPRMSMCINNCKYILKSGKNKGVKCNKGCNDEFCKTHMNHGDITCTAVIKSGKNKGNLCGCIAKQGELCNRHIK